MSNLFVGNISFNTTEETLLSTFSQYGNVERVKIITDRETGQPRGFAFVEMSQAQEARKAIAELSGANIDGRTINVSEARPKTEGQGYSDRSGNSGGGGRTERNRW